MRSTSLGLSVLLYSFCKKVKELPKNANLDMDVRLSDGDVTIDAKCINSGNAFQSINSCNENVIINFINFEIMASLVKTFCVMRTILKREKAITTLFYAEDSVLRIFLSRTSL